MLDRRSPIVMDFQRSKTLFRSVYNILGERIGHIMELMSKFLKWILLWIIKWLYMPLGNGWSSKLCFRSDNTVRYLSAGELKKLKKKPGFNEPIKKVFLYEVPLNSSLTRSKNSTKSGLLHAYIVCETENYFWSLEKHPDSITLQRSKEERKIKCEFLGKQRPGAGVLMCEFDATDGTECFTFRQLLVWLNDILDERYHVVLSNFQDFAAKGFRCIT